MLGILCVLLLLLFWNYTDVLVMVSICSGYNPLIIFDTFSQIDFSHFLGVYYYQNKNAVSLTYLFHDSSYIFKGKH